MRRRRKEKKRKKTGRRMRRGGGTVNDPLALALFKRKVQGGLSDGSRNRRSRSFLRMSVDLRVSSRYYKEFRQNTTLRRLQSSGALFAHPPLSAGGRTLPRKRTGG